MRDGFIRTAAATPKIKVADPVHNRETICRIIEEYEKKGAELLVFPELCLSGYTCNDLFQQEILLEQVKEELKNLGFRCLNSKSNFIFAMHPDYDAKELFEALKENDIYVRFWGSERIEQYMRITVGTREEMEAMFAFLKKYMNK